MTVSPRFDRAVKAWQVSIDDVTETGTSLIAFGRQHEQPVVIKMPREIASEREAAGALRAFEGRGTVKLLDDLDGVLLLERLDPGTPLSHHIASIGDEEGSRILAGVIRTMSPSAPAQTLPTVHDWNLSFDRYASSGDDRIPQPLVAEAHALYSSLCASQADVRLLHGDLHHDNVLFDSTRGWVAVDPKGVIGEIEYEIGAAMRNPCDRDDLFLDSQTIQKRIDCFVGELNLNPWRVAAWAFAQAVLACIWLREDGDIVSPQHPWLALADRLRPLVV